MTASSWMCGLENTQQQHAQTWKDRSPITWFDASSNCQDGTRWWEQAERILIVYGVKFSSSFLTFGKLAILGCCGSDPEYLVEVHTGNPFSRFLRVVVVVGYQ